MLDVWRFQTNPVDDISGPLADAKVIQDGRPNTDFGIASGNTLVVLGTEELHRRRCRSFAQYLEVRPELSAELYSD